jgi:hypothetical protein
MNSWFPGLKAFHRQLHLPVGKAARLCFLYSLRFNLLTFSMSVFLLEPSLPCLP